MQDKLYQVMVARYESEIDDAKFKISTLVDRPMIIPEHVDITGEVDKLLQKISSAEDRMAAMRRPSSQRGRTSPRSQGRKRVPRSSWARPSALLLLSSC